MNTILIIGNNNDFNKWKEVFINHGYTCTQSLSLPMKGYLEQKSFDLILIIDTPNLNSSSICIEIRKVINTPIVTIIGNRKTSIVTLLRSGTDVCLFQPVYEEELIARTNALLRSSGKRIYNIIYFNDLEWNKNLLKLYYYNKIIPLTPKEFNILGILLNKADKVITPIELTKVIWEDQTISPHTIHSYIRNIRDKIRDAGFPIDKHLITVWGTGYQWCKLDCDYIGI